MHFVYALIDPRTNILRYIGQTTNISKRLSRHCHPNPKDHTYRANWVRRILATGGRPELVVLDEAPDRPRATILECFWIASLRACGATLVNLTDGGDGGPVRLGMTSSQEHKDKIRTSHTGLRHTEEAKAKMSRTRKGMRMSAEARSKLSATLRGRRRSDEEKARLSLVVTAAWKKRKEEGLPSVYYPRRPLRHGTPWAYMQGCRCKACHAAKYYVHR